MDVSVSDQAMWDDARWESKVDKGAGVYSIESREGWREEVEGREGEGRGS